MPEAVDALDTVERRGRPDGSGDLALEVARKERGGRQPRPDRVRHRRRAGEDRAVLADQREHVVFGLSDRGVEGLQRCDLDERHRDGAVVRAAPADGEAEGAHGLRAHHFADEGFRTAGPVGARIVPAGEVDVRRRPRLAPDDETPRVEAHHAHGLGRRRRSGSGRRGTPGSAPNAPHRPSRAPRCAQVLRPAAFPGPRSAGAPALHRRGTRSTRARASLSRLLHVHQALAASSASGTRSARAVIRQNSRRPTWRDDLLRNRRRARAAWSPRRIRTPITVRRGVSRSSILTSTGGGKMRCSRKLNLRPTS